MALEKVNMKIADLSFTYGTVLKLVVELGSKSMDGSRDNIAKEYMYTSKDKYSDVNKLSTLAFTPRWYLVLETKSKKDMGGKVNICILPKQIPRLLKYFKSLVRILDIENLFYLDDSDSNNVELKVNSAYKGKVVQESFGFKGLDNIVATPEVFYDSNDLDPHEGLSLKLNGDDRASFEMTLEDIEYLNFILDKTDFINGVITLSTGVGLPEDIELVNMDAKRYYDKNTSYSQNSEVTKMGNPNVVKQLLSRNSKKEITKVGTDLL